MTFAPLLLRKHEEKRLRAGHLWVFSNEVDTERTPLTEFAPGDPVVITAANGKALGSGYVNPHSLICARLVSRQGHSLDKSLLVHRLKVALALRDRVFDRPYYRLVYGESDGLPGLVVDRFDDALVVQIGTAGMERVKEAIIAALGQVLAPRTVLLRNDGQSRELEGLAQYVEDALEPTPETVALEENGVRFRAPVRTGQKTGWFFDHRLNRRRACAYVRGKRVLDVFSYLGGWGVQAAVAGAARVVCVEASGEAVARLGENAALNGVDGRMSAYHGDAFDTLRLLKAEQERFDVVILDPPAFIKRKKDVKNGLQAYRRVNRMAMQLLGKDGILVSGSCSYHLRWDAFQEILNAGARHLDRRLQVLERGHQGPDHPVHPALPETDYLKCAIGRVVLD